MHPAKAVIIVFTDLSIIRRSYFVMLKKFRGFEFRQSGEGYRRKLNHGETFPIYGIENHDPYNESSEVQTLGINVLSNCSNIISHRSSVFEGRHNDHRSSKVGTSIIDLRRSTHRPSIFEGRHIDIRRSKAETSHQQPNIAPTCRHLILSTTALHSYT